MLIINESGLYSLAFASRKDSAKAFKKWITATVIPSIRQHGGYINGQEALAPEAQQETLQVIQNEALRVGLNCAEEKQARSDAFRLMGSGSRRRKRKMPRMYPVEDTRNGV
jgi:prophage antirepressor-like protein